MYASRLTQIQPFRVVEVLERARALERDGHEVVHFEVGEPDFETAEPILAAAAQGLRDGATKYTEALGTPALREAIAGHYRRLGIDVAPGRIVVTTGASAGLLLLAGLLLDPGQELLLPDPGYPCNGVFAQLVGARAHKLPVYAREGFAPTIEALRAAWGERSKVLLLASPSNPTGSLLPAPRLRQLAAATRELGGVCLLDEIYQGLTYTEGHGASDTDYASGLAVDPQLYVINSFSKYFGMTGWRLGWVVVPREEDAMALAPLAQNLYISPPALSQHAALAAFSDEALAQHESRRQEFRRRRDRLYAGLKSLGFRLASPPEGAFYIYAGLQDLGYAGDAMSFCRWLLEEFHVAVTPGDDFGNHAADAHVRFAYTTDMAGIELGLERIGNALSAL